MCPFRPSVLVEAQWIVGWTGLRLLQCLHSLDFGGISLCLWGCFHSTSVSSQCKSADGQRLLIPPPSLLANLGHFIEKILSRFPNWIVFSVPPSLIQGLQCFACVYVSFGWSGLGQVDGVGGGQMVLTASVCQLLHVMHVLPIETFQGRIPSHFTV